MTNYITAVGVQQFSITIASGSTTGTATINAVGSGAFIVMGGTNPSVSNNPAEDFAQVTLTNSTTITATRNTGTAGTVVVTGCIVDGDTTNLIKTVTYGTITIANTASSGTATTLTGTVGNTAIHLLGWSSANTTLSGVNEYPVLTLPANVPTATRVGTSGTLTVSYVAIEFQSSAMTVNAVQQIAATSSSSVTSYTASLGANVVLANTICFYSGSSISVVTTNIAEIKQRGALTGVGTFTVNVNTAVADAKKYNASCVELNSGVLNSAVQRGTTTLTGVTSNTTTLTAVNETYSGVSWLGNTATATTAVLNEAEGASQLTTASSGGGPITIKQQGLGEWTSSGTTSALGAVFTSTTAGSLLTVGFFLEGGGTISSAVDNKGQTWIPVSGAQASDSGSSSAVDWWYFPNSVSGVINLTVTYSTAFGVIGTAYELAGVAISSPVETSGVINNHASSSTAVSKALTTTTSGDIILVIEGGNPSSNTVAAPYTIDSEETETAYHITTTTVSSESATFTLGTASTYCTSSVAFKPALVVVNDVVKVTKATSTANITGSWEVFEFPAFSGGAPTTILGTGGSISEFAFSESPISGSPKPGFLGSLAITQAVDIMAASAKETFTGTISVAEALDTMSASAKETFTGTVSIVEALDVMAASAKETFISTISITEALDVMVATAVETFTSTIAITEALDTMSASATVASSSTTGTISIVEALDVMTASGIVANPIAGTIAITEALDVLSGVFSVTKKTSNASTNWAYPWLNPDGSRKEKPYVKNTHKAEDEEKIAFRKAIRETIRPSIKQESPIVSKPIPVVLTRKEALAQLSELQNYELEILLLLAA